MTDYFPERTIRYKTYVKTALVEAFRDVFKNHKDKLLQHTQVTIDYPKKEADYPTVIVRFFERDIMNAGIAHEEWIELFDGEDSQGWFLFKHYFYKGDLEFAVYGLSSYDRDLISDTLVQTIAMGGLETYTNRFFLRIYTDNADLYPGAIDHYININTDTIQGFGESQTPTPWASEDELIYTTSYRVPVFGEFYSPPPDLPAPLIETFTMYPYIAGVEPVPQGDPGDGAQWMPPLRFSLSDPGQWWG